MLLDFVILSHDVRSIDAVETFLGFNRPSGYACPIVSYFVSSLPPTASQIQVN